MNTALILIGFFVMSLISNALTNFVIFHDKFELDTDATPILVATLLWEIMIPLCLLILFTKLVKLVIDKVSEKISDKIINYRLSKVQINSYKDTIEEGKASKTKEA